MIKPLRILGNIEGVSYLLLLGVAMPLKYFYDIPEAVKVTGMAHGVLFIAYCILLVLCMRKFNWSIGFGAFLFMASLIPFGTFVTDRKLKEIAVSYISRIEKKEKKRARDITVVCPNIIIKLSEDGFSSLNAEERNVLFELCENLATNTHNWHKNEVKALEAAFSDQSTYNILEMRNNQMMRINQAEALVSLKNIKSASIVSGMNAAREIGESFGD